MSLIRLEVRSVVAASLVAAPLGAACLEVDVGQQAAPGRVHAEFDPGAAAPRAPFPNNLAIDPTSGAWSFPPGFFATPAEQELAEYLTQLDGFPPESLPWFTFDGDIEPSSLLGAVSIFDLTEADASKLPPSFRIEYDTPGRRVTLSTSGPFVPGHTYGVIVRSGASAGVRDKIGRPVLASPTFFLIRGTRSLVTCKDLSNPDCQSVTDVIPAQSPDPTKARAERAKAALALEHLRLSLLPVFDRAAMASPSVPLEEIALAWTFRVATTPTARFAPGSSAEVPIPFPTEMLRQADGTIQIPILPSDPAPLQQLKMDIRTLDGFSTTGPIRAGVDLPDLPGSPPVPQALDVGTLNATAMPIVLVGGGKADMTVTWEPESQAVLARPNRPLKSKTLYMAALTSALTTERGRPVRAPLSMALLRMKSPLVDAAGVSQIRGLPDATALQAEAARKPLEPVWMLAEATLGLPRAEIAVLFPFQTQTVSETLLTLHGTAARFGTPTAATGTVKPATDAAYMAWPMGAVSRVVEGTLQVPELIGVGTVGLPFATDWATAAAPRRTATVNYMLTLPKCMPVGKSKAPVAIVLHSFFASRFMVLEAADAFAQKCIALAAMDLPYHGDRSLCGSPADCTSGVCDVTTGKCSGGDFVRFDGTPQSSGTGFVNPASLFASRDNIRQIVVDTAQFVRVLQAANGPGALPGVLIDASVPAIVGTSIGGMVAAPYLAAAPVASVGVLTTTSADVVGTLLESPSFSMIVAQLKSFGLEPGTRSFREFETAARWVLDPAEPANYAELVTQKPLKDAGGDLLPPKKVMVQMGGKDAFTPNRFTRYYATLLGVSLDLTTFPDAGASVVFNFTDADHDRAAAQAATFVAIDGAMIPAP